MWVLQDSTPTFRVRKINGLYIKHVNGLWPTTCKNFYGLTGTLSCTWCLVEPTSIETMTFSPI
jgi:hypothetical protein